MNTDLPGRFENWQEGVGYQLYFHHVDKKWFGQTKTIWRFRLIHEHPAQFVQNDGTVIRPAAEFLTDGGSSPIVTQGWVNPFRFLGFFWHDSGYRDQGLTVKAAGEDRYRFMKLSQGQLDAMLRVMCRCDPVLPCGRWKAGLIWGVLRGCGWYAWNFAKGS